MRLLMSKPYGGLLGRLSGWYAVRWLEMSYRDNNRAVQ